ncbi:MAG: radical SAM protein [Candidatus Verstraetearchaeota archaeon]|nr:radical SAM protein [Candidatus Verstraetearchaeota archaeon]
MQIDRIENVFFSTIVNPVLRRALGFLDYNCPKDGNLLIKSLRIFLGQDIVLCDRCKAIYENLAKPIYKIGTKLLRVDRSFMQQQFLEDQYGEAWFRGFALMMRGIRKYGIRIPFTPAAPFLIVWNYTYKCNLRCKHCYEDAGRKKPELSTDETKQVLDILSKLSNVGLPALAFSGGEPLAREDFFEVVAYAKKRIPYVSLATNGTLITKDNAERLKDAGIDYVEISLDGASAATHDWFRGIPGAFERTMEGIKNCIDVGIDTCIATVIQKENFAEVEKIVNLADELGVRFIHFNYIPTGRAKAHIELDLTPKERLHVLQVIGNKIIDLYLKAKEEELKFGKSSVKVDRFFSTCPQYASVTKELSQQKGENFMVAAHYAAKKGVENVANFLGGCGAGRLYCAIEPNGDIKPCVFFPTNKETVLGNILKDDFEEIWDNHPLLWKLRIRENLKTYEVNGKIVGCGACPDKYICGGCRARAYSYFNGDITAADIGCIKNDELWSSIIKIINAKART